MSQHIMPDPPLKRPEPVLPDRRLQRFLDPGEVVRWWEGPNQGPWMRWATRHVQLLLGLGLICFFLGILGGMGLCALAGVNPGVGCAIGAALGVVAILVACNVAGAVERQIWLAVTDRRLLVVQGQKKLQDYDLDVLRRALATAGGSAPAGDDRVVDLGKLPRTALGPADGITDADSLLALARLVGRRVGPG